MSERRVRLFADSPDCPPVPMVASGGTARAVVWPGVGAHLRSLHHLTLEPGGATVELRHPGEAVYYVVDGAATVHDGAMASAQDLLQGAMVHVEPGTPYRFVAGPDGADLVGGPSPADPALYARLGVS